MRVPDWPVKMLAVIDAHRDTPREYGRWDCCQFMGEHVFAITGIDHRERFPRYASRREGLAILAGHGGLDGLLTELFGPSKPPAFAQRGDLVIADLGDGLAGGVCVGVETWTVSPAGLERVKTLSCTAAWTVE